MRRMLLGAPGTKRQVHVRALYFPQYLVQRSLDDESSWLVSRTIPRLASDTPTWGATYILQMTCLTLGTKKQCVHMYMNLDLSHGNCPYLYKVWDAQAACIHGHNFYNKYNVMYVCICSCCINSMMSNVITSYRFVTYSDVIAMTRREDVPVAWDQWVRVEVLRPRRLIQCLPFEE